MRRGDDDRDDPAQAWRQLTHWLVNDVPRRADVRVDTSKDPSQPVTIVATARDEAYLPLDNATVELKITPLSGDPFTLKAEMDEAEPGTYTATYWSREPGGYRVDAKITVGRWKRGRHRGVGLDGTVRGGGVRVTCESTDRCLEKIAEQTGGEVVREDRLERFCGRSPDAKSTGYRDLGLSDLASTVGDVGRDGVPVLRMGSASLEGTGMTTENHTAVSCCLPCASSHAICCSAEAQDTSGDTAEAHDTGARSSW